MCVQHFHMIIPQHKPIWNDIRRDFKNKYLELIINVVIIIDNCLILNNISHVDDLIKMKSPPHKPSCILIIQSVQNHDI